MNELEPEQVAELKQALLSLQNELKALLESTREDTKPVEPDAAIGRLTRLDAIQQQKMTVANRRDYDLKLRQVSQSLTFMDRGTYGVCRKCEDPIGFARLVARPESPYCLDCQDEIDRKHA